MAASLTEKSPIEAGHARKSPTANADYLNRLPYGLIVVASANELFHIHGGRLSQQPDAAFTVVGGYCSEFVVNPPFVFLQNMIVSIQGRRHKFLSRHFGDASAHVAASGVWGNILFEATTFVE